MDIEPFEITVPSAVLADLRERLARTRFPEQLPDAGWDHGTELGYLRELVSYWGDGYDWRATEARLNELDNFTTEIDGARIHFVHARSPEADALPLIVTHGWPDSIIGFLDVIGPLSDPSAHGGDPTDAFHVVCPSLPGFAFSGPTRERGWNPRRVAAAWAELMDGLGYGRYGAQGGDWGSIVTQQLAHLDAEHLVGIHLNTLEPDPGGDDPSTFTPDEQADLAATAAYYDDDDGYFRIQSTRPQTIGYALEDSPAGLAAWIIEKWRGWSDCDGDLERRFTKDRLLDNIMLYWVTATANSSARLYFEHNEALRSGELDMSSRILVPTGFAHFPAEIMRTSRRWAERGHNLVHYSDMPRGGHFAAMEEPVLFVDDVRTCFRGLR